MAFVNSFGAYYDAREFFIQIASNTFSNSPGGGKTEPWAVDALTRRIFVNEIIQVVDDPAERELLTRRFVEGAAGDAEVSDADLAGLSEGADISRRLLEGTTPEAAAALFDRMPADFRRGA